MPLDSNLSQTAPTRRGRPWILILLAVALLLGGAGLYRFSQLPGKVLGKGAALVRQMAGEAVTVARAFREGTVRQEFLSHATELTGTNRLQFATLQQSETFRRSEKDTIAWGLIPLPPVVVQAQAPVEYTYFLDLRAPWDFRQEGQTVTVLAPAISANTPALDVSALTFFTLEGSVWRDDHAVRERLRETLTATLRERARENYPLIRETGRRKVTEFVEQWLIRKFGDGPEYRVKVIFADEAPLLPQERPAL